MRGHHASKGEAGGTRLPNVVNTWKYKRKNARAGLGPANASAMDMTLHQRAGVGSHLSGRLRVWSAFVAILLASAAASAQQPFAPAQYRDGAVPGLPSDAVTGAGEVMLELLVGDDGIVRAVNVLESTPPYTEMVMALARGWRFTPAEAEVVDATGRLTRRAVDSTVLVAAVFTAPSLNGPTLGELPQQVGVEADSTPFPVVKTVPGYPPLAWNGGVVMIETTVGLNSRPLGSRMVQSLQPFDAVALAALDQWTFRPARIRGAWTPTVAYVIFGFRQPGIVAPTSPKPGAKPSTPSNTPPRPAGAPTSVVVTPATAPLQATPPARPTTGTPQLGR